MIYLLMITGVLTVCKANVSPSFLVFRDTSKSATPDILTSYYGEPVFWHGAWPTGLRVMLFGNKNVTLQFSCEIKKLPPKDAYNEVFFRFFNSSNGGDLATGPRQPGRSRVKFGKHEMSVNMFSNKDGGVTVLNDVPPTTSLDRVRFLCQFENRRGLLTSNVVEMCDYRAQFPRGVRKVNGPTTSFISDNPASFPCLERPLETPDDVYVDFGWRICGGHAVNNRPWSCPSVLKLSNKWRVQILRNGTLFWSYVPSDVVPKLQDKRLWCTISGQPVARYLKPLNIISVEKSRKALRLRQPPLEYDRKVSLLDSDTTDVRLPLIITGDGDDVKVRWTDENGRKLSTGERKGTCFPTTSGVLRCRGGFDGDHEYRVEVVRGTQSPLQGSYFVNTSVGYPKMSNSMRNEILVVDGGDAQLECRFERPDIVYAELTVLGRTISTTRHFSESLKAVNDMYRSVMVPLNATLSHIIPTKGKTLRYTVYNMVFKSDKNLTSSHYVECIGTKRNELSVRRQVFFQVVPRPRMARSGIPVSYGCPECPKLIVRCVVANKKEIEAFGAKVHITWKLGNRTVKELRPGLRQLCEEKEGGSELHVSSSADSAILERLNKAEIVECVVDLRYANDGSTFYSSSADPDLRRNLTAKIKLRAEKAATTQSPTTSPIPKQCNCPNSNPSTQSNTNNTLVIIVVILVIILVGVISFIILYRCRNHPPDCCKSTSDRCMAPLMSCICNVDQPNAGNNDRHGNYELVGVQTPTAPTAKPQTDTANTSPKTGPTGEGERDNLLPSTTGRKDTDTHASRDETEGAHTQLAPTTPTSNPQTSKRNPSGTATPQTDTANTSTTTGTTGEGEKKDQSLPRTTGREDDTHASRDETEGARIQPGNQNVENLVPLRPAETAADNEDPITEIRRSYTETSHLRV